MSESILKALVHLFALIANFDNHSVSGGARAIVESFLKNQFGQALTDEYMILFDTYYEQHQSKTDKKRLSSNSVKILAICSQINEELYQEQKFLVVLQLLEFIHFGGNVNELEIGFIDTVSEAFNLEKDEYEDCKAIILYAAKDVPNQKNLLIVSGDDKERLGVPYQYAFHENLGGDLIFLHIKSTNTIIFGYVGQNNLFINGQPIIPKRAYVLVKGSSIRSSKIAPIYYSDVLGTFLQNRTKGGVSFVARDLEFMFPNSTNGLHNFNFKAEGGELVGVMGGSGAGKSTLLNIFNGTLYPKQGEILINGYDIHTEKENIEGIIGFVPQDDLLIEELTVYQNLYYNAKLCLDNFSEKKINSVIEKILSDLDLLEIQNLKVGSPLNKYISGGQRKRLNIALELLREPSVLFVDEPTSGLSSNDSEMVMDLLKEQTLKGKLAIVNIHQPSSDIYKLFDKLIVMDKGGYPIYYGNPIDAIIYFKEASNYVNAQESECPVCGNVNPEQVLQIVEAKVVDEYGKITGARKKEPKEWYDLYRLRIEKKIEDPVKEKLPESFFKIPHRCKQFRIFTLRDIFSKITNTQYLLLTFLEAPFLAIILGYFTKYIAGKEYVFSDNENIPAYIFMAVVVSLFLGLTVSAEEIIKDRKILQREHFLNLSKTGYLNSKVLLLFFISAIQTLSFVLLGNYILGIQGLTFSYWLVLFTTSAFANLLGLNISASLNSVVTIYILIPFILVPELLLSGVIVSFDKLHKSIASEEYVPFVGSLMTSRWAYEALTVNQFVNNKYEKNFYFLEQKLSEYKYLSTVLIPKIEDIVTFIDNNIKNPKQEEELIEKLHILQNEIAFLERKSKQSAGFLSQITYKLWSQQTSAQARKYLRKIKNHYIQQKYKLSDRLDKKTIQVQKELGGEIALRKLKDDYYNKALANLVQSQKELEKIKEGKHKLIQKTDPIFQLPTNKIGRAHFYAPFKILGNKIIPTYTFNILFIWFTNLLLYIVLRLDLGKKIFSIFTKPRY